jgi:ABC-type sugar transport system ATPase subunit
MGETASPPAAGSGLESNRPGVASGDAVVARGLSKSFGGVLALNRVDVTVRRGEIHGFVGANGAGKSTVLGLIAGRLEPTSGALQVLGQRLEPGSPRAARDAGVAAIYQELTIVPALSAAANMFVGRELSRYGCLRFDTMQAQFRDRAAALGVDIDPSGPAGALSVADQQMVEILRALDCEAQLLLLDEPTSALAVHEREALFDVMRRLRGDGVTMVLVSHDLEEVLEVCDRVTVFRDGEVVSTAPAPEWTKAALVEAMLGASAGPSPKRREGHRSESGPPLLEARDVVAPGLRSPVSFSLRSGEILGIAGVVGSGRSALIRALGGAGRRSVGRVVIDGRSIPLPRTPRKALKHGLALITEDRRNEGIVGLRPAADNIVLSDYGRVSAMGFIVGGRLTRHARAAADQVWLPPDRLQTAAINLSGGNQQKLLAARWIHRRPRVLLADEPTRGVDVGAKAQILELLQSFADDGLGVIIVSSELEELIEICHRILVMSQGQVVGELDNIDSSVTEGEILDLAFRLGDAA